MMRKPKRPFVLGLTGSIGMGKSATAKMFSALDVPVHDADAVVHELYAPGGGAAVAVAQMFPDVIDAAGGVDRTRLRAAVLDSPERMKALEAIVHPLVRAASTDFLAGHADAALVVLDVPLLYETKGEARCDAVVLVTAPPEVQRARVLARPGMTEAAFEAILKKQMPDVQKRARADYVIDTSHGFAAAEAEVSRIVSRVTETARERERTTRA